MKNKIGIIADQGLFVSSRLLEKIYNISIVNSDKNDIKDFEILLVQSANAPSGSMLYKNKSKDKDIIEDYRKIIQSFIDNKCHFFCICSNIVYEVKNTLLEGLLDKINFIDLLQESAFYYKNNHYLKIGILCSNDCRKIDIFSTYFSSFGIKVLYPSYVNQNLVTDSIALSNKSTLNNIVNNEDIQQGYQSAINDLVAQGVDAVLIGSADIFVDNLQYSHLSIISTLDILAQSCYNSAIGRIYGANININQSTVINFFNTMADKNNIYSTTFRDKEYAKNYILKEYNEVIAKFCRQSLKVLDVGCGAAVFTEFFLDKTRYTGIDGAEKLIEIAKNEYPYNKNIDFKCLSLDSLKEIEDKSYDFILSTGVIQYLNNGDLTKLLTNIIDNFKSLKTLYFRTTISNIDKSLTLNNFQSDKLGSYSTIYRTVKEYNLFFKIFIDNNFAKVKENYLFQEDKNGETCKYYWVFKKIENDT